MENRFMIIKAKNDRFAVGTDIVVDLETGVQYLYFSAGYGGGLTVMVDAAGKPLIYAGPENYEY